MKHQFIKGYTPWNKGKKGVQTAWNKGKKGYLAGKEHYNWRGGKRITNQGYVEIKSPNHPLKNKQGYVPKHRLVAEKYLGRYLTCKEIIHHIDGNPLNNKIKNLYLFSKRWQHCVYHRYLNVGKIKPITQSNIIGEKTLLFSDVPDGDEIV